jgi:hypothetical protein
MLSPQQQKKLERLAKVLDNGDIALLTELDTLESRLEGIEVQLPALREAVDGRDGYTPIKDKDYRDGVDGYTPIKGVDYVDGKDGRTPIFIGNQRPKNPQKGDLWYHD